MYHHNTIRKYVSALLSKFNDFETKYKTSTGQEIDKKIPIVYDDREKSIILDSISVKELSEGIYSVLPKGYLALVALSKSENRITNKLRKQQLVRKENTIEFSYNSVPYEFTFQLSIMCRGMNQTAQIIEQVCPMFNPTIEIDIWDADNLSEPTRVPVRLLDVGIENVGYSETSTNILIVNFSISMLGYLYQPIKELPRVNTVIENGIKLIDGAYNTSNMHFQQDTNSAFYDDVFGWD